MTSAGQGDRATARSARLTGQPMIFSLLTHTRRSSGNGSSVIAMGLPFSLSALSTSAMWRLTFLPFDSEFRGVAVLPVLLLLLTESSLIDSESIIIISASLDPLNFGI